jgi:cytochrome c
VHTILEGKKPFMVPFKDKLAAPDAGQLVKLVRDFSKGKKVEAEAVKPIVPTPDKPKIVEGPSKEKKGPTTTDAELAARLEAATALYRQYCASCHGTNGRGEEMRGGMPKIPDFTDRRWQEGVSNAQVVVAILNGKDLMPAFADRITGSQPRDLTAYLRAFGPARPPPEEGGVPASDFEKQYRKLQEEWKELRKQLRELEKPAAEK